LPVTHLTRDAIGVAVSVEIRGHQRQSVAIRGNPWPSEAQAERDP
jgi:hypothetical protein